MGLKNLLFIFFLFSFLFFSFSFFSFSLGLYLVDYNSLVVEIFLPFSLVSEIPLTFFIDYISLFFFSAVSLISGVVFLYRKFYMDDSFYTLSFMNLRFFYLLFLFVFSIFFLVFSGSWVVVMLGWDGLGLVSFLLVIYYRDRSSLDSGLITVFTNRLGDCLFILSFIFMFYSGWVTLEFMAFGDMILFGLVVFLGCVTKRAQLPFSSWLPAAIAAPTPVSSLVHSSTLVTAGVYLLVRFNFLLDPIYFVLAPISLFTMFLAGFCAVFELDFKKVVAMSTLSQLGFMIFSVSRGFWLLCYLHIVFHAFFKRSLFLRTGNLMHYLLGGQDSRSFGSLGLSYVSKLFFTTSRLRLAGFPFSLGFYSKDRVLGVLVFDFSSIVSFIFVLGCCFTVAYRLRLIYIGFFSFPRFFPSLSFSESWFFYLPMVLLYLSCVFFGNFFFFYFLPPLSLSFFDFFLGIFILFGGVFLFYFVPFYYFLLILMSGISFLSVFSSSLFSGVVSLFSFKGEYSWGETFGGRGASNLFFLSRGYFLGFYASYFFSFLFTVFLVYFLLS